MKTKLEEHDDFNVPGINLLDPQLVKELKELDPRSTFSWQTKYRGVISIRKVSRGEYIKLQMEKKGG